MAAMFKVHEKEGQIIKHIDLGEFVIEFNRIEQSWPAIDEADVAQVQIAMTLAHPAARRAFVQHSSRVLTGQMAGFIDGLNDITIEVIRRQRRKNRPIVIDDHS